MREAEGIAVKGLPLGEILESAGPRVRLLKIDCEGAEHVILSEAILARVEEICGELHCIAPGALVPKSLDASGLKVTFKKNGPNTALFWARTVRE